MSADLARAIAAGLTIPESPLDKAIGKILENHQGDLGMGSDSSSWRPSIGSPEEFAKALQSVSAPMAPERLAKALSTSGGGEDPAGDIGHRSLSASASPSVNQDAMREALTGMSTEDGMGGAEQVWSEDDVAKMQQLHNAQASSKPLARDPGASGGAGLAATVKQQMGAPSGPTSGALKDFEGQAMSKGMEVQYYLSNNMLFSDEEDQRISKAMGPTGYVTEEVTLGVPGSLLMKSRGCPNCGARHQAMLTRCPGCGFNHAGNTGGHGGLMLSKSVRETIRHTPSGDLYLPNGIVIE